MPLWQSMQESVKAVRRRRSQLATNLTEKLSTIAVVQAFGQVCRERQRLRRQSRRLREAMVRRARIVGGLRAVTEGTAAVATCPWAKRQRIALARALVGNPKLLLLDEADANLDQNASLILDRILSEYRATILLVTHRPERLAIADTIWRFDSGRLLEIDPPVALPTVHQRPLLRNCLAMWKPSITPLP